jgi:MoaA/NifB/PqqE/SkfB family radical SAM enzyme
MPGPAPQPQTLYLEVTNRCNLRCPACILYRGRWEPERDISWEEFIMITDQMTTLERAVLHGIGEPLLHPNLASMVRHLKRRKATVLFNSNGILLDEKRQEELIDAGIDEIRISLDAASPQGYQAMRKSGQFNQVLENLRACMAQLKSRGLSRPRISLWFLGTRENIDELPQFIHLAADLGVSEIYLQRLVFFLDREGCGLAKPSSTLGGPGKRYCDLIEQSQEKARQLGIQFCASGMTDPLDSVKGEGSASSPWKACLRPWQVVYITAHGNVLPCCISPFSTSNYPEIILGNIFETPLARIWSGPRYQAFRERHQTLSPFPCCTGCGVDWSL